MKSSDIDLESERENTFVVYITGILFFSNASALKAKMAEIPDECEELIFSLRGVPQIDFVGAQTFMDIIRRNQDNGVKVMVCGMQDKVKNTLLRCNINDILPEENFYWSVDKALIDS